MLGTFDNFPISIHLRETFSSEISKKNLQRKIVQVFQGINKEQLSFEQVSNPTLPACSIIFEFGIADNLSFRYLDEEMVEKLQKVIASEKLNIMDWFCLIRYYKILKEGKRPLKFDYYMLRIEFREKGMTEISVFHDHGMRYVTPEDLVFFIARRLNYGSTRRILKT